VPRSTLPTRPADVGLGYLQLASQHDLDVIRASDWVIDLGPAGGAAGGEVVAEGTPEQIAQVRASRTGAFLRGPLDVT
jgi:excinuclease ABC subunit A